MALPTILVNSATGSDSAASGAGPATAITGSAGHTDGLGTTVILDGSPDLSGVATDGSAVFYLQQGAGAPNFATITAVDNSAKTVTVAVSLSGSGPSLPWAIGGKRASIGSTSSKLLFDNNSAAGDALPGWVIEMESGHTETITATFARRRGGDQTDGPIVLKGTSGAATMPVVTFSNNGSCFEARGSYMVFQDFEIRNSNATKTASVAINWITSSAGVVARGMVVSHATNKFWKAFVCATAKVLIENCHVANCANIGITSPDRQGLKLVGCTVRDCGSHGVSLLGGGAVLEHVVTKCRIYGNAGDGINRTSGASTGDSLTITHNTIHDNTSDGIEIALAAASSASQAAMWIESNQITSNGAYGLNLSGTSMSLIAWSSTGARATHNNAWNNTSGACNLSGVLENDLGSDPSYTDAANGDFSIGAAAQEQGYPTADWLGFATRPYYDIGAEQHQDAGGGGPVAVQRVIQNIGTY